MNRHWFFRLALLLVLYGASAARAGESFRAADSGPVQDTLPLLIVETGDGAWGAWGRGGGDAVLSLTNRDPGDPLAGTIAVVFNCVVKALPDAGPDPKGRHGIFLTSRENGSGGNVQPILGMPESDRWTLLGSIADKMMLRNYLGHVMGAGVCREGAPGVRYVEVVHRTPSGDEYMGLFLLSQWVEQGVWLNGAAERNASFTVTFRPDSDPSAPAGDVSRNAIPAKAAPDAAAKRVASGRLGTGDIDSVFADAPAGDGGKAAEKQIRALEELLFSEVPNTYFTAFGSLNLNSFVDSYLLKELFQQSGGEQFYLCRSGSGEFALRPKWNFDYAVDNDAVPVAALETDLNSYTWFSRLILSYDVVRGVKARYYQLLRNGLGPERVAGIVDDAAIMLGRAMERDWERWREAYMRDSETRLRPIEWDDRGQKFSLRRAVANPHETVLQVKSDLLLQSRKMRTEVMERQWVRHRFDRSMDSVRNLMYAMVFLLSFCLLAYISRRMV